MSIIISQGELYEIVKKGKLETIEESEELDQTDGKKRDESLNKLIIENEAQKFIKLFEKTFLEETEEIDCEDGAIQDISKVVLKIKEKIENAEKSSTGLKLLRLLFVLMVRTRAVPRRRPTKINFDIRRVAATKEITNARRTRINDIKIKFLLPQGKNVEVKKSGNVVRRMRVRRRAIYPTRARNVRYDRN